MEKTTATIVLGGVAIACVVGIVLIVQEAAGVSNLTQVGIISVTALSNLASVCAGGIGGIITGDYMAKKPKDDKQTAK